MMSVKASLLRAAALLLAAGALAFPLRARADITDGLSIRAGIVIPTKDNARDVIDFGAWGGGIEYKVPWFPTLLGGEYWSTSLSADFHYSERKTGIARSLVFSINQVYSFEEQNGNTPYAGFCLSAVTFGGNRVVTSGNNGNNGDGGETGGELIVRSRQEGSTTTRQPMITRFGAGLILGLNIGRSLYLEGRYEWFDKHHAFETPEGFRAYVGYRF